MVHIFYATVSYGVCMGECGVSFLVWQKVVEVSKKYLPFMAEGFNSPKLELHIGDGLQFIKDTPRKFDVVITDSSDPVGEARLVVSGRVHTKLRFPSLAEATRPRGTACSRNSSAKLLKLGYTIPCSHRLKEPH